MHTSTPLPEQLHSPDQQLRSPDQPLRPMHLAIDVGFVLLMLVGGLRYFAFHPLAGLGVWALALSITSTVAYICAIFLAKHPTLRAAGILTATALWLPLAVMTPSFDWSAFALVFSVHRALRRPAAIALSVVIVLAVAAGLFLLSGGADLGLVFGPLVGGLVMLTTYAALDQALANRRRLNDELIATRSQLAQTEREAGALAERSRFSSELHDTVVQRTASALMLLESLSDTDDAAALRAKSAEARSVLRESLVETRELLHGAPVPAADRALSSTLEPLAQGAGASFVVDGEERPVGDAVTHALVRITQEALLNAEKHAHASELRVTLTFFDGAAGVGAVGIDVLDNGAGFDAAGLAAGATATNTAAAPASAPPAAASHAGFGLRAMAWRAESLGGTLTVESRLGDGTVVSAWIPVTAEESR